VKLISAARVKTDARDTIKLARLLAANLIPAVWVPPLPVRELRALVTHRSCLVQQRIQARNRLQGVLQRHNLDAPEGDAFARGTRDWWRSLALSMAEQLRVCQDLALLDVLDSLIAEVEQHVGRLSMTPPWEQQVPFLLQLPVLGMVCAMTILAAVGDIARFPTSKQLVGYAGLGTRIHASGQVQSSGGSPRKAAANCASPWSKLLGWPSNIIPKGSGEFERLSVRIGKPKAIVAIARKLLVAVWHVLSRQRADIHADVQAVARSLLRWTARCGTRCRQTPLSGSALASLPGSVGTWRRSGSNSLQRSPLSPQRCAPGKRKGLRALLLPFLSGLPESITLLLPVKTRADAGLLCFATPVLTRLSMRCLQLLGLIQRQKIGWSFVLLTCCSHRCQTSRWDFRIKA
jgi:transposase